MRMRARQEMERMKLRLDEPTADIARREATALSTIWFALAVSIGAYVLVGSLFSQAGETVSMARARVTLGGLDIPLSAVRWGFIAAALAGLAATGFVARRYLGEGRILAMAVGPSSDARVVAGFAYLRRYSFLAWVLAEAVILLGTLLAIMSGRPIDMLPFAVAGGTSLFLLKPEIPNLLDLADRMAAQPESPFP